MFVQSVDYHWSAVDVSDSVGFSNLILLFCSYEVIMMKPMV